MSADRFGRWLHDRCDHCGKRFGWKGDARHSRGNRDGKVWHRNCLGYLNAKNEANERLEVLALIRELTGVTSTDLQAVVGLREQSEDRRSADCNKVFRAFHAMDKTS